MKNRDGNTLKHSENDEDSDSNLNLKYDKDRILQRFEIETENNNLHLEFLLTSLTELVKEKYESEQGASSGIMDNPVVKIDFEIFLKRFIDAILQPDVIDSCIAKALP